jgi:hypothetical protein
MPKPESFIASSDYATLKNDGFITFSLTLPGGIVVPGSTNYTQGQDFTVGKIGASERARIASSKDGNAFYSTLQLSTLRFGSTAGSPTIYNNNAYLRRSGPNTLRAELVIYNPYTDPLVTEAGDQVFTFEVNTFLSPFV